MNSVISQDFAARIDALMISDRSDLRRLKRTIAQRERLGKPISVLSAKLNKRLTQSEQRIVRRRATPLTIAYPDQLPISAVRDQIAAAMRQHPVIIVCGDTGSGKTTQLPKICLDSGRGIAGMIGHTQPRRIAARAVAARLGQELGVPAGAAVGLKIRFSDSSDPTSLVKVMTDGILLNEIREDRWLEAYDTLIIDEAHERSLNIDFILGYLRRVLKRRNDLKVIVTSATIDPQKLADHFDGAPILNVTGRTFPVEFRYRPRERGAELADAVVDAAHECAAIDLAEIGAGKQRDMLVFLPGQRWISDAEHALAKRGPKDFEILPLYARLDAKQQQRIFNPGKASRIVLATNVAETSLTVPRIRFVIDSGLARVSRYAARHRVQCLRVEAIAQASAVQRAGRCGRVAPGICLRLYSEADFEQRPDFTEPEILRTDLAGVILRLASMGLGQVDDFPFLDAPPIKAVNDAYRLLHVLGAMDAERNLSSDGRLMGRLPVDPRLARLLLNAKAAGVLADAVVLAAALSVADPREFPQDNPEAAREKHQQFADPRSDFITYLNLWRMYRRKRREPARNFRDWCKKHHLSALRLREWDDVHAQLKDLVVNLGWRYSKADTNDKAIHRVLLSAFIDFVAEKGEAGNYRGMHEARAKLFPGSSVAKKQPRWVVAAEHVATERTYLRTVAQINPRWLLQAAPHLLKRDYRDPYWEPQRGRVTAREIITLFGLLVTENRRVDYGPIDPIEARRLFIHEALLADNLGEDLQFIEYNRRIRASILDWEARIRSRDLFIGDRGLFESYDRLLPTTVRDRASLRAWCRHGDNAMRLELSSDQLSTRNIAELPEARFPLTIELAAQSLPLVYVYEPGADNDGISVTIHRMLLNAIQSHLLDWLVPGCLASKVIAMLRALPKETRRQLVPLPDTVSALMPQLELRFGQQDLVSALREVLAEARGIMIAEDAFDPEALAPHLRMRIEVIDDSGTTLAVDRNLSRLQAQFGASAIEAQRQSQQYGDSWSRTGLKSWNFGDLPDRVELKRHGGRLELYPLLLDVDGRADLGLLPPGPTASAQHRLGVRRLLLMRLHQQVALVRDLVWGDRDVLLGFHGIGNSDQLVDDVICAAADQCCAPDAVIRKGSQFNACLEDGRASFVLTAERLLEMLRELVAQHREIRKTLAELAPRLNEATVTDLNTQVDGLIHPYFLSDTPTEWRSHLKRYLQAVQMRLDKIRQHHPKDVEYQHKVGLASEHYRQWRKRLPPGWPEPPAMQQYRWLLEEFRVSLFAQTLGTALPVSERRLQDAWVQASTLEST